MDGITIVYLILVFIALYMFSFFIILSVRNRGRLFDYPKPNDRFFVSVIIPAFNEEESIGETIRHVADSNYPKNRFEIIVVDDGSEDKTSDIVKRLQRKYKNLKLTKKKNSGKADSLNIGIREAKGELIAVVDSDSFPEKESLKKLTGYFNDKRMGAVTSFVRVRNKDKFFGKLQALEYVLMGWSRKLLDYVDSVYVTNGPLSMYRRDYVLEAGGFDPKCVTEDIEITWNLLDKGYRTGMCLDAEVTTNVPLNFRSWLRQRVRWGIGGFQVISKYKRMFFRKGIFGAFILPFVSFSIIFSIFTFLFSSYLLLKYMLTQSLTTGYSVYANTYVLRFEDLNLTPSVILFYFVVLFILSISFSIYVLKSTREMSVKKVFNILFYTLVYLSLYPMVWFICIYRYFRRDFRW